MEPGPAADDVITDLTDLTDVRLTDLGEAVEAGKVDADKTLRRVAPADGTQLLVAASFNSAV